ncbi:MAG: DUF4163 domain-containing protein [Flavobacteriaceae bacterium]|nr:DUF4163 domain-containing protein [Flavobacteriaceae bacterium]
MNYRFFSFILLIFLTACTTDNTISFSSEIFTEEQLEICESDFCSEIEVNYLKALGNSKVSEKINAKINQFIIASLFLGEDDVPAAKNIDDAATDFILAYRDHQVDIPAELDSGGYFADISTVELFQNNDFLSLEMRQYLFTGGAHGYGTVHFLNIDTETGDELKTEDLFSNVEGFTDFAEKVFRNEHGIDVNDSINATGFWFDNETFYLPETIGFTESKVILIYNAYEIASYGAGAIELEIPIAEVQPFLNNVVL